MAAYNTEELQVTPYLDMELFLTNSQENRVDGKVMDDLLGKWESWMPHLRARRINAGGDSYLAVWLDEHVEDEVDDVWDDAPSEAFLYNALAQTLCMSAVHDLLPDVAEAGCAPAPRPTVELKTALEGESLRDEDEDSPELALNRRYAVATYYPFRGGCDICHLKDMCPKLRDGGDSYSVVLPGYEREGGGD